MKKCCDFSISGLSNSSTGARQPITYAGTARFGSKRRSKNVLNRTCKSSRFCSASSSPINAGVIYGGYGPSVTSHLVSSLLPTSHDRSLAHTAETIGRINRRIYDCPWVKKYAVNKVTAGVDSRNKVLISKASRVIL